MAVVNEGSLVGQQRANRSGLCTIEIVGCYGFGSGGFLYSVKLDGSNVIHACGMRHDDVLRDYPVLIQQPHAAKSI